MSSRTRRSTRRLVVLAAALGLVLAAAPATAETLLVLGVARDGKADLKLSRQIQDRLGHGGETVAQAPRLTASERLCVAQDCLDALAAREQASVVLTASVQRSSGGNHAMAALLYDAVRRKPFEASSECERCMPETLSLRVGELFERLLKEHRSRAASEPVAQATPAPTSGLTSGPTSGSASGTAKTAAEPARPSPASQTASSPAPTRTATAATAEPAARQQVLYPPRMQAVDESEVPRGLESSSERRRPLISLSPTRKIIAGVLGGVAGAALITAIALNVSNGQPTSMDCSAAEGAPKFCVTDYRALYGAGYALAGLSLVGLGVTLFWPSGESSPSGKKVARRDW